MVVLLFLLPFLILISSLVLYRHNGKREIMRLDVVQFTYAFLLLPVAFIWMKSFIYVVLRSQLGSAISQGDLFLIDTTFSTLFLFIYAFVVIHSLTKSFELKRYRDPLYDMFDHSEFFHMTVSHLAIYGGSLVLVSLIGGLNLVVPLEVEYDRPRFYSMMVGAVVTGTVGFVGLWNYNAPTPSFMRIMKLLCGLLFTAFAVLYLILEPSFSSSYLIYWFVFFNLLTLVILGLVAEKNELETRFSRYLPFKINPKKVAWFALFTKRKLSAVLFKRS